MTIYNGQKVIFHTFKTLLHFMQIEAKKVFKERKSFVNHFLDTFRSIIWSMHNKNSASVA